MIWYTRILEKYNVHGVTTVSSIDASYMNQLWLILVLVVIMILTVDLSLVEVRRKYYILWISIQIHKVVNKQKDLHYKFIEKAMFSELLGLKKML